MSLQPWQLTLCRTTDLNKWIIQLFIRFIQLWNLIEQFGWLHLQRLHRKLPTTMTYTVVSLDQDYLHGLAAALQDFRQESFPVYWETERTEPEYSVCKRDHLWDIAYSYKYTLFIFLIIFLIFFTNNKSTQMQSSAFKKHQIINKTISSLEKGQHENKSMAAILISI